MKKIMVTLNDVQYKELCKKNILGESDSEKLRNSFVVYLQTEQLIKLLGRK